MCRREPSGEQVPFQAQGTGLPPIAAEAVGDILNRPGNHLCIADVHGFSSLRYYCRMPNFTSQKAKRLPCLVAAPPRPARKDAQGTLACPGWENLIVRSHFTNQTGRLVPAAQENATCQKHESVQGNRLGPEKAKMKRTNGCRRMFWRPSSFYGQSDIQG